MLKDVKSLELHAADPQMQEFMQFQKTFHHSRISPHRGSFNASLNNTMKDPHSITTEEVHMMLLGHSIPKNERHEVAMTDHIAKASSNFINGLAEKQLGFNKKRFFTKRDTVGM